MGVDFIRNCKGGWGCTRFYRKVYTAAPRRSDGEAETDGSYPAYELHSRSLTSIAARTLWQDWVPAYPSSSASNDTRRHYVTLSKICSDKKIAMLPEEVKGIRPKGKHRRSREERRRRSTGWAGSPTHCFSEKPSRIKLKSSKTVTTTAHSTQCPLTSNLRLFRPKSTARNLHGGKISRLV